MKAEESGVPERFSDAAPDDAVEGKPAKPVRDRYVDFLRAFSLVVVVVWHWVFTVLVLSESSVSPSNPIGSMRWLWLVTWVFQVMPVFFFVGGYVHRRAFDAYTPGTSRRFLRKRVRRLVPPSLALVVVWVGFGAVFSTVTGWDWVWSAVILVLSPLWFLAMYLMLVALTPLAVRAHWRWGELVLVWLLGTAAVLDVLRFSQGQGWAAWLNFIVIWAFAHQLGFYYDRLVAAPRRVAWIFTWGGLFGLIALTNLGFYPRSAVGVPGERFSNMGPPTLVIVALILFQVGLVLLLRDWVLGRLETSAPWQKLFRWVNTNALPLFLFHTTGMAIAVALIFVTFSHVPPDAPTWEWWLTRPIWLLLPALFTYPFLIAYRQATQTS